VRFARWIDHLPPWLAWGAVISTGIYAPFELVFMALPLLAAALVEWRRWTLGRWRRIFEVWALVELVGLLGARIGLVPTVIHMLFMLSGIRLALPREMPQRRQILLMGFLIWLTTAISSLEMGFFFWTLAWLAGAILVLLQQSWEGSAGHHRALPAPPPYFRILRWSLATLALAALFFVMLPRLSLGLRAFPWGVAGLTASRAGMSDLVDLGGGTSIQPNNEVVLRILPPKELPRSEWERWGRSLELLRGLALERADGLSWKPGTGSWTPPRQPAGELRGKPGVLEFDYFIAPSPQGILPLPYGSMALDPLPGMPLRSGFGGSLRWMFPTRRSISVHAYCDPAVPFLDPLPPGQRQRELLETSPETSCADRWSRQVVPEDASPRILASRLGERLQSFSYTLENPSGTAENPLEDFLERSQAGHCEYFAVALATMLRQRGVPARVVNGYRLGPWISEGGYWLVTQNEAHAWVEYYDRETRSWQVEDPTPSAPPNALTQETYFASLQRWMDTLRYKWDRHVVRFSDEDQISGMEWMRDKAAALSDLRPGARSLWIGVLLALGVALVWVWRWFPETRSDRSGTMGILALRPLLRTTRRHLEPFQGETSRVWLLRLATLRPERTIQLRKLADEVDAEAYGDQKPGQAAELAKSEAKAWKAIKN